MMNFQLAKEILQQRKGRKTELEDTIKQTMEKIKTERKYLKNVEQAHTIIKEIGLRTQQQLRYHISDVTSVALEGIFDQPYNVVLDFVDRRGKTECDILFNRNGAEIDPLSASGGGVVDVAAFALRIASYTMQIKKTRNTIILDEPFRYLSKDLHERASQMLLEISKKLKIQFIIVTHEQVLGQYADKVFEVSIKKGISQVKGG